mmetsp:Transcript_21659/g.36886  ORF Transcript_21659/g.36886 Transcript_21659/m.36886 type:complete len:444 (-) Transcript_21659:308-1639(-)
MRIVVVIGVRASNDCCAMAPAAGDLRQRKQKGGLSSKSKNKSNSNDSSKNKNKKTAKNRPRKQEEKWLYVAVLVLYFPFILFVNPMTLSNLYYLVTRPRCEGICSLDDTTTTSTMSPCAMVDANRLIFMRIPKTASSTTLKLLEMASKHKSTLVVDFGEMEEYVSSIPVPNLAKARLGYHNPSTFPARLRLFFRRAATQTVYPPFQNQDRTVYHGHFPYLDFAQQAPVLATTPIVAKYQHLLPKFMHPLYGLSSSNQSPIDTLNNNNNTVATMTLLRHPIQRLSSMYYYDRHTTRHEPWRNEFVQVFGNATLQDCLLDDSCVQRNQLESKCSLQVHMVCGIACATNATVTNDHALLLAKQQLRKLSFVGISDRMDESMQLLWNIFPTFLMDEMPQAIPNEKHQPNKETTFTSEANQVLQRICRYDQELYDQANILLTERLNQC